MTNAPKADPGNNRECPTIVIVCGLPATGKSSLAAELRERLDWPLFSKDQFKELLYDAVQHEPNTPFSRAESVAIGQQSIALLFATARELLETGVSCVIEANFLPGLANADLDPLLELAQGRQVHCAIPDDLVLDRYRKRAEAGERHPVHVDQDAEADLIQRIEHGGGRPLPLAIPLMAVDCTDGWNPGIDEILAFCLN